jgi:ribosomal protein S18 acetylase RimI-like enzyme
MDIEIRKIEKGDENKAYEFCIGIFDEMGWDKRFGYDLKNLANTFGGDREAFFVAVNNGEIISCGGVNCLADKTALMRRFYTAENFRGKGLATSMLEKIKEFAKENGYKEIVLDVFKDNIRAIKFYKKNGFKNFKPKPCGNWHDLDYPKLFDFQKLKLK